jgi:pimeloyl-ACP methyl ester carboxylesterase
LHFNIIKGKGIPILFEAGAGNDGSVWNELLKPITGITGTTLITYDRVGLGKSSADTSRRSIADGIRLLEEGLRQLGYNGAIMLVAHSRGALYATTYANRNPQKVKIAVLIDGSSACSCQLNLTTVKYQDTVLKTLSFPHAVQVVAHVSDDAPFGSQADKANWKDCQRKFVAAAPNRTGIVAYGCGHYIFKDKLKCYDNLTVMFKMCISLVYSDET